MSKDADGIYTCPYHKSHRKDIYKNRDDIDNIKLKMVRLEFLSAGNLITMIAILLKLFEVI